MPAGLVTITEQLPQRASGGQPSGTFTFTLTSWLDDGIGKLYPAAPESMSLTSAGLLSISLPPSDIGGTGQAYKVDAVVNGVARPPIYVAVPSSLIGQTVTLSSLAVNYSVAPVTSNPTLVTGSPGPPGSPGVAPFVASVGGGGQVTLTLPSYQWAIGPDGNGYFLNGAPVPTGYTAALIGVDLRLYPIGVPA